MEHIGNIDPNQFAHVRMVLGMVVGLAIARILSGLAKFAQHPRRLKPYGVHLLWPLYMLVGLIQFWWWEFALRRLADWHFVSFAFVVGYGAVLYLLCAVVFPDEIAEYDGFRGYFMSRRPWFFGILGLVLALDVFDTWLKGTDYLMAQGMEYGARTIVGLALCVVAARVESQRFHLGFVLLSLAGQAWWILGRYKVLV